jgi:tRNA(Ile)-lysidine synthase
MAGIVGRVAQAVAALADVGRGLVVAVSGGPDSVALLRALVAARPPSEPWPLTVAHLNHQLRGDASDADEAFVAELHACLSASGIPGLGLRQRRLDVGGLARAEGGNLEAVARDARYRWLAEVAAEVGAAWVATGHTADDQAETVLHRLLRGSGLEGLRGIAGRRSLAPGVGLVRPLLRVPRGDILAYLAALGQPARQDASNSDLRLTRNRIRQELLPYLAGYNPNVRESLARLAEQAEEAFAAEDEAARQLLREVELPRAGPVLVLDAERLAAAPRRLVRLLFRALWRREGWPRGDLDFAAWERLADVAAGSLAATDLPGHVHVRRRGGVLQVCRPER